MSSITGSNSVDAVQKSEVNGGVATTNLDLNPIEHVWDKIRN